ncbi:MAG: response regulator [Lachnospiraceae bacterium]|nr:response regulator [Lachnospiraceae bacterium]
MSKFGSSEKNRTVYVLFFFALALVIVGVVLRSRIGALLTSYTENETEKQAEVYALLMEEKLNTELENLEYIASRLEADLDDLDDLMPNLYNDNGIRQGLLSIDGKALYGDKVDVMVYDGIQSSFRGKKVMTFAQQEGLLFTCPVFNGPNIRYVLYRLCSIENLENYFATSIFDDLGKFCVTTREGNIVIPFYNADQEDMDWYKSNIIQDEYASMHMEMEVSVAVARCFDTDRGDMVLFESEIPGTDFIVSGYVPKSVAAEGIGNITLLVVWVFGLLMVLVMIGAFYLTKVSIKARESDELRKAKALAEEASKAKSDFLANMSHEIRTPINAVLGMNEMILRESRDNTINTYASNIKNSGETLLGIINDILDFSKIEAGKTELIPVEYDLADALYDLVSQIRIRLEAKGLTLKLDLDEDIPGGLYGDLIRIKQIIMNILTNAVKYTEKGSVTFTVGYKKAEDDPESIFLTVSVEDTGIGIKPEDMEKLFRKFERIEQERNRNIEGTGLGMSITTRLLELMDSKLEVESEYGVGSVFSFELKQKVVNWEPIGDFETAISERSGKNAKYHEKFKAPSANVLVVDDNDMNLMVFINLLRQTEVKIDTAESGDQGLELTKNKKYDIIFLDHMMPDKDGIETLKELREQKDNPNVDTVAVCLTANAVSGAKNMYLSAGFDDYLAKPINFKILEEMLIKYIPPEKTSVSYDAEEDEDISEGSISEKGDDQSSENERRIKKELENIKKSGIIDIDKGIENSGSIRGYLPILKIFYDSIEEKAGEIERYLNDGDLKNYTIKVHALKSSARIIGATEFGEEAQVLENAGKSNDIDYIREHQKGFMNKYRSFKKALSGIFETMKQSDKTVADKQLLDDAYKEIYDAADAMDCDRLSEVFKELDAYSIPKNDAGLWKSLKDAASDYDYEKIQILMRENGKID